MTYTDTEIETALLYHSSQARLSLESKEILSAAATRANISGTYDSIIGQILSTTVKEFSAKGTLSLSRFPQKVIQRTRGALKDLAAGNTQECTMADLDLACEMLDEMTKIKATENKLATKEDSLHTIGALFMVCWDDQQGLCSPMVWDASCQGAICSGVEEADKVAVFATRQAARKAIKISTKWNALLAIQGKPHSEDFDSKYRKNLCVFECTSSNEN